MIFLSITWGLKKKKFTYAAENIFLHNTGTCLKLSAQKMLFEIFCFRTLTFELSEIGISKNQGIRVFRGLKKIKTRVLGFTERKTLPMQLNFFFT